MRPDLSSQKDSQLVTGGHWVFRGISVKVGSASLLIATCTRVAQVEDS